MKVVSRTEAIKQGAKRYFIGKPCPKGHMSEKYTSNEGCITCLRAEHKKWAAANRNKVNARIQRWREVNPEKNKAAYQRWQRENPERVKDNARAWRLANPDKVKTAAHKSRVKNIDAARAAVRRWMRARPWYGAAKQAQRRAALLQRTPVWADLKKIEQIYAAAQSMTLALDEPWHVDHIFPLQGDRVSGLHVPNNLRALQGDENMSKNNHFDPGAEA